MPKFEIELDDKGEFVGTLAAGIRPPCWTDRPPRTGKASGKAAQKAAEEAKQQIADAIKAEKAKLEASLPLERAKWDEIDS
jgi:hypothetical protein